MTMLLVSRDIASIALFLVLFDPIFGNCILKASTMKFTLGEDTRRWTPNCSDLTLRELQNKARELYGIASDGMVLKYTDPEGDMVTLATDEDVREMLQQPASRVLVDFPNMGTLNENIQCRARNRIREPDRCAQGLEPSGPGCSQQFYPYEGTAGYLCRRYGLHCHRNPGCAPYHFHSHHCVGGAHCGRRCHL
mmetsp:Transcript_8929/g.21513  ORF Transcript_8929/g.21513 Transcript_8929/m.21513 type:complete len:193 (+) Transcript_8929:93-671(+)